MIRLDEFYFDNYAKDGNSILRPIHYLQLHQSLKMQLELHTVTSTWLLVMGAKVKAYKLKPQREWIDAIAEPDSC
jgi:isopenicillin N synthase-like dioxygenase